MAQKKRSRSWIMASVVAVLVAGFTYAFWPRPVLVDIETARVGPMQVTIDEIGRTQVHDTYIVSTPTTGRLLRPNVEPGDQVTAGETIVARMLPMNPAALDVRTKEQARAGVQAAEAALRAAIAELELAHSEHDVALSELARAKSLFGSGTISQAALETAERAARAAGAGEEAASAKLSMQRANVENARALLIGFDDRGLADALAGNGADVIDLFAPADGWVLRVMQQSESTVPAGAPVLEIGDVKNDLEVTVELLSTDAVGIDIGQKVIITNWGGDHDLTGHISHVDPFGYTKYSALGVEEQRVSATVRFDTPAENRIGLGHGFRVDVRVVTWNAEGALVISSGALFRHDGGWAVYVVDDGRVSLRAVHVAANNGLQAAIDSGLAAGEAVILYPTPSVSPGIQVSQRIGE